jgi:anti-anti-sigma factor
MEQSAAFTVGLNESRVKVSGELDVLTSPSMIDAVLEAATSALDLSDVTFIDARGLAALLRLRRSRPELEIISVSPCVQHLLEMTDTADQLQIGSRIPAVA